MEGQAQDEGQNLLLQISNGMVRAQKEFFGKGPTKAKSYLLDDFLLIVMRGSQTQAEQTMLEFGQEHLVREFRQQFENEVADTLTRMVERVTGRRVLTYQSQILFEPEVVIEIFFFDGPEPREVEATARGQLEHRSVGEARAGAEQEDVSGEIRAD